MSWAIMHLLALLIGFCLDLLLGDPHWAPHPVRAIGALIAGLEKGLRRLFPKSPAGELAGGVVLVVFTLAIPTGLTAGVLWVCRQASPWLALGVESVLSYQLLATKSLAAESRKVYDALKAGDLDKARYAVSMIVGRDTAVLDEAGVSRAAVETVAENASDGVIAPLLFLAVGGAPLGMLYKAANTMDSMVGYRNETYLYFGRTAARLDDVLNFLPARMAGVLLCLGAAAAGYDGKNAWRIFQRDRKNHKSPNSAHTEAACAGALQLRLAGPNFYFGKLVDKPYIGDDQRPIEPLDILRAGRILYAAAFFALLLFCGLPLLILLFP
ncbi:adenosylcobinamide-phosphate synthase CbiB [uncultured Flavonifractor sp.]|uniref:adenosylcobinamide-phosphate synthase CbiB n=1 Tax=uncultured Flavonifractor sp. TaxID=1193534 RepID=UPI0026079F10|nr:adenosylcobinamide-phosphate synthase CbiB [uncultured Flavonifractor sp.]